MILARSGHDRASIVILDLSRPPSDPVEVIPRRKLHDRGSIASRSRFDPTVIVEFFHETSGPSDGARDFDEGRTFQRSPRVAKVR